MNRFVYLDFPDLTDFLKFLKLHNVRTIGMIQKQVISKDLINLFFRLTAKVNTAEVVARCDVSIWKGIRFDLNEEKYRRAKDEKLKEVEKTIKEAEELYYHFKTVDAEYTLPEV